MPRRTVWPSRILFALLLPVTGHRLRGLKAPPPIDNPPGSGDAVLEHALVTAQHAAQERAHLHSLMHNGGPSSVTVGVCNDVAGELGGGASCSLMTTVSGAPEGCECRVTGGTCAFPDTLKQPPFQMTGMAPSIPYTTPEGITVILCAYFQWIPGGDNSAADAARKDASVRVVKRLVAEANDYAAGAAGFRTGWMWAMTPTPFPTTPPPAGCSAGQVPVNPYSGLKLKYAALAHGTTEVVQCPVNYKGSVTIGCDHGNAVARCLSSPWVEGDGKVSCCMAGCPTLCCPNCSKKD